MIKISVIIVNYNTKDTLQECLINLTNNNYENLEIIIFDNASDDGAPEMVKSDFPSVKLLSENTNKGISYGFNRATEASSGEYVLYLGSDAFPSKEVIIGLIEYLEQHPDVGIATAKLVTLDGSLDMDAHRGFPTPWTSFTHFSRLNKIFAKSKLFNQYYREYEDFSQPHEIDACISHFMFVPRKVIDAVHGWDEDYFVYGEDIDFCYRVKQAGLKVMYLPQFEVLHYKGVSIGIRKISAHISKTSMDKKILMKKSSTNAMKIFYDKHYTNKYPKILNYTIINGIKVLSWTRINLFKLRNFNAK